MEQPPIIQSETVMARKAGLGRIGLCFSLAAVGAFAAMMLFRPG